ncbi:large proline-rich protein BAG6 isoform X5 [Drosophila gunungcola]|uniref:large proline-rich protein BAG6 isoform X5 n=1 Tax=Drosophila gunungcola TaxID=103775 RepID=UPI0022E089B0|nr:large proline-rich protein BAG6 isoform X5 [Drosophila gunungcola]
MLINLKVKTLDARTHEFSIDNELTIRQFKDQIAEKTNIAAENQRIIYQGRVLADDKQVKEYDVDGKVLHVAERPPFSQRGANSRNNDEPMRPFRNVARPAPPGMRTSPYFRALDGMLVGTMAIPVNNGPVAGVSFSGRSSTDGFSNPFLNFQTRTPPNRYPNSSSFCVNRITVALHMIDCADNIAAYLENPAVGLNNQSLDILQRGRWSMESTVVEVGVSSTDLPRNNNIIDMVQDAVTAALSRTGARNYTVVQLPTVYTNENGETSEQRAGEAASSEGAATGTASDASGETTAATVIIEDVIETDDEAADGASDRSATPTPETEAEGAVGGQPAAAAADADTPSSSNGAANDAAAGGEGGNNSGPRRRTRPQVLAQVIQHYRGVQTRLAPFVDRYYEILQNDPTFEENDTAGRANAQRIFDRVSEAFHYLSHAQHAISDLMLDLSQPGPRVLTCRPILVEQSGYIRSNNIFTPNFLTMPPAVLNDPIRAFSAAAAAVTQTPTSAATPNAVQAATDASRSAAAMAEIASRAAGAAAEMAAGAASAAAAAARGLVSDHVEDPVDEPMVAPNSTGAGQQAQQQPRLEMDPQQEMARIIQAVVNRATNEASDLHVEFNSPNVMSINLPVHVMTAAVRQEPTPGAAEGSAPSAPAAEESPESAPAAGSEDSPTAASTSSGTRSGDQRANTLPTTATQTRSTSRPQIQIGGNNNWGGRIAPTHTAFDRFLPCNSHHIREPEPLPHHNNNISGAANMRSTSIAPAGGATVVSPTSAIGTRPAPAGSAVAAVGGSGGATASVAPGGAVTVALATAAAPPQAVPATPAHTGGQSSNLRSQLRSFLNDSLFAGVPINEQTIPGAIGRALEWFGESLVYLPQYERPEYNSRDSVCNILRVSLRLIIELCSAAPGGTDSAQFEQTLKQICDQFRKRLYSVLFLCLGSANAELYWRQLMRLLCAPMRSNFHNEALQFLCIYIDPTIPAQTDTVDAQQFLVLRSVQAVPPTACREPQSQTQTLDLDVEMAELATSSSSSSSPASQMPSVVVGSEPWHMSFPNDWLPVITRDLQTQTEQNSRPQPPFSDAYISGMSAKRRKIIQSEKPTASVECLIANGVQRAIHGAGLGGTGGGGASSSSISTDAVIGSIAHDAAIQASYTDAVRNSLKERIKQDADFKSSKYPQIAKFAEQK